MRYFYILVGLVMLAVSAVGQSVDINWQGYINTGSPTARVSFYLADSGLDLTTAFNDENYPVWYSENNTLDITGGVAHTVLREISVDSLEKYRGNLYLYVTVNGQPYDKVALTSVPYSAVSDKSAFAHEAEHAMMADMALMADTATYAVNAGHSVLADSSAYSVQAYHSFYADSSLEAVHSVYADSALHSVYAMRTSMADNSQFALVADSAITARYAYDAARSVESQHAVSATNAVYADTANYALELAFNTVSTNHIIDATIQRIDLADEIVDESAIANQAVTSTKIQNGTVSVEDMNIAGNPSSISYLSYNNGTFQWASTNNVYVPSVQKTNVIPTQINPEARWVILQVAQDFNLVPLYTAQTTLPVEGRLITIVNASTANFVTLDGTAWNIFGGNLVITPRTSATLMYIQGEWVVVAQ